MSLDSDVVVVGPSIAGCTAARLLVDEVRGDPESAVRELYACLPYAPDPWSGERIEVHRPGRQ